jgi:HEAT repeat protein
VAGLVDEPIEALTKRMKEANPAERAAILFVFSNRKDPAALDTVVAALKDEDRGVRLLAVSALGPVGAEKAVPLLAKLLPGDLPELQQALQLALVNVPGAGSNNALAKALAELPQDGNLAASRLIFMNVLAQRRTMQAGPEVLKLATDADEKVRMRAFETLAKIASGDVAPGLVALLAKVPEGREQQACTDALIAACGNIGDEKERLKPLQPAIETGEAKQRVQLLGVAGRIGTGEAMAVLVKTLSDANADVADAAMRALCDFPNDRPWQMLQDLAKENPNPKHQVMAFKGCVRLAEQKKNDGERLTMLQVIVPLAKRPEDRMQLFGLLGNIQSKQALKLVTEYLADETTRPNAALAAISISRKLRDKEAAAVKEAMEKLLAVVQDPKVRGTAEGLLKEVDKK